MKNKKERILAAKNAIKQHILMNRFLRDIEREEPLDQEILQTLPIRIPVRNR